MLRSLTEGGPPGDGPPAPFRDRAGRYDAAMRIAFVISPHGFGHATRAAALMEALAAARPEVRFEIFTAVPEWLFEDWLAAPFAWHRLEADIGFVQKSPLEEDLPATVAALERFAAAGEERVEGLTRRLTDLDCRAVVADIAPLGLLAAERAGLPGILVENFTWDWIYAAYLDAEPRLAPYAERFGKIYESATLRIQAEPACHPLEPGTAVRHVPPIARRFRRGREETRSALGVEPGRPLVFVTTGGVAWEFGDVGWLARHPEIDFVLFGGVPRKTRSGNVILLPDRSPVFVPDLVAAADAVVAKPGYGTVGEVWRAGTRFALVERPRFPEAPVLADFVRRELPSTDISAADFAAGLWTEALPALLEKPRPEAPRVDGNDQAAKAILESIAP